MFLCVSERVRTPTHQREGRCEMVRRVIPVSLAAWKMPPSTSILTALVHSSSSANLGLHQHNNVQWNPSNADTNGAEESVLYREVSLFQGLKCMQEWYLGRQKVSLLERCPQFRGVLIACT